MAPTDAAHPPPDTSSWSRRDLIAAIWPRGHAAVGGDSPARPSPEPPGDHWVRVHRRAMACRFDVTLAATDGASVPCAVRALDEIDRLERDLSVFIDSSAMCRINREAATRAVAVPEEVATLLTHCQRVHQDTEGAFDPTITPLSRCWGFLRREARVPPPSAIDAARRCVGFGDVQVHTESSAVRFGRPGLEVSLGAVGKGYALDRAAVILRHSGVRHALLSAGGSSLVAVGGGDRGWMVDLVSPLRHAPLATITLRDAALGTSGAGEQFVLEDGRRYGHVIDPRTGWPAEGLLSVSVVASSAMLADALSTAFLVGGIDLARRYCREHPDVLAVITPDDDTGRPLIVGRHPTARLAAEEPHCS